MGETPAWWQVTGLSGCCGWNSGLGAGKEGEWTEGRLDPSLMRQDSLPCYCWKARRGTPHLTLHDRCSLLSETDFTFKHVRSR